MKKIMIDKVIENEIIRLYNEEYLGSPSISEKLNLKKHIVLRVLKENNVKLGSSGMKYKGGKSVSDKRYYQKHKEKTKKTILRSRELNPGLPRDRRGY